MLKKFDFFLSQSYSAEADGFAFMWSGCMLPMIDKELRDVVLLVQRTIDQH